MDRRILKLYEGCVIVSGKERSIIMDIQRKTYYHVPNSLIALFDEKHVFNPDEIELTEENISIVTEYKEFLIRNELCFYCDESLTDNFPTLDITNWDYPAAITNAIIEIGSEGLQVHDNNILTLTNKLFTRHIEFYFSNTISLSYLEQVLKIFNQLDLYSYDIIFGLKDNEEQADALKLLGEHYKIHRIIIYRAGINKIVSQDVNGWGNIFLMNERFSYNQCGVTDLNYMSLRLDHITESHNYNTCLNRKIFIDAKGIVRNCPNMPVTGNVNEQTLQEIINTPDFKKYWGIKKDDIKVCRDCEFRHICTDCRAFREDPDDIYSKPLKCGYNPYTCEWEEWSTNPLKQKAIEYYDLKNEQLGLKTTY